MSVRKSEISSKNNRPSPLENFAKEALEDGIPFIKFFKNPLGEYGHSGAQNLTLDKKIVHSFERLKGTLSQYEDIDILPLKAIVSNRIYSRMAAENIVIGIPWLNLLFMNL